MLDKYDWDDGKLMLSSLTKACKMVNDTVKTRLPIHGHLLEMMLFEIERYFNGQQLYLQSLFKALLAMGYYGLLRVGELTASPHVVKAKNVNLGVNKDKLLIVLYSSKTHDESVRPQKIKIQSDKTGLMAFPHRNKKNMKLAQRCFCPFNLINDYIKRRKLIKETVTSDEQFFIYQDGSPVQGEQVRNILRELINRLGLNGSLYDVHSLRIGRSSDMAKFGYTIGEIKRAGRWRSNSVFKYIRM